MVCVCVCVRTHACKNPLNQGPCTFSITKFQTYHLLESISCLAQL